MENVQTTSAYKVYQNMKQKRKNKTDASQSNTKKYKAAKLQLQHNTNKRNYQLNTPDAETDELVINYQKISKNGQSSSAANILIISSDSNSNENGNKKVSQIKSHSKEKSELKRTKRVSFQTTNSTEEKRASSSSQGKPILKKDVSNTDGDSQTEEESLELFRPSVRSKQSENKKVERVQGQCFCLESTTQIVDDSVTSGKDALLTMISPTDINEFLKDTWESRPLLVQRNLKDYFSNILSTESIDKALRTQKMYFTKNIDVTSYSIEKQVRETLNPPGRATAPLVWNYYDCGCSIRILNPQTFFPSVHSFCARLQEYFQCFVGANLYLTPPGNQGFAPHYDDIEAFVLQIEGKKLWKIYLPRDPDEILPRESSKNFLHEELGEKIYEDVLEAGDTLYFPRGYAHEAVALPDHHSLHITISLYQKNSWADFMEILLPAALQTAVASDVNFRRGLPLHYLSHLGAVNFDKKTKIRKDFEKYFEVLMKKLTKYAPIDAAADQMAKNFIHSALPPYIRTAEKELSCFGHGETIKDGKVINLVDFTLDTQIKLIRYNCIRVVYEDENPRIYYTLGNSLEYHGEEPQYLETDDSNIEAFEALIHAYPRFINVNDLPIADDNAKLQLVRDIWDVGIIFTKTPLKSLCD